MTVEELPVPRRRSPQESVERTRRAVALAGLVFAATAPLTYGAMRGVERWRDPVVDPGQILTPTHMAFVWRSLVAGWFGVACAGLVFLATRDGGRADGVVRRLTLAVVLIGVGLALVALRFP